MKATEHVFTVDTPRLATFLVACAPFRESAAISASGVTVRVLRSAMAAADGDVEAPLGGKIVSFYETLWPAYPRRDLKIVETPTPLGEALAFDGEGSDQRQDNCQPGVPWPRLRQQLARICNGA